MNGQTRIVPILLGDGTQIRAHVESLGGDQDVADLGTALAFSEITKTIESIAKTLKDTMDRVTPNKATVEFGIELAVESGQLISLLAQANASSTLKISLEWEK